MTQSDGLRPRTIMAFHRAHRYVQRREVRAQPCATTCRRAYVEIARRVVPTRLHRLHSAAIRDTEYTIQAPIAESVGQSLYIYGVYEPLASRVFASLLARGDTALDVGAHLGDYAFIAASRVGPNGRVIAFEPQDNLRDLLLANIQRNHLSNVTVLPHALSDRDGEQSLYSTGTQETGAASLLSSYAGQDERSVLVEVRRMDSLLETTTAGRIAAIKIDVEGLEAAVLRGGERLLARDHPAIVFEVNGLSAEDCRYRCETFDVLEEYGYSWYGMIPDRLRGFRLEHVKPGDDPSRFQESWLALNLVAITPSSVPEARLRAGNHFT